jgi:hypothetical protein
MDDSSGIVGVFFILLFIAIFVGIIWLSIKRMQLMKHAIDSGHPEVAEGMILSSAATTISSELMGSRW